MVCFQEPTPRFPYDLNCNLQHDVEMTWPTIQYLLERADERLKVGNPTPALKWGSISARQVGGDEPSMASVYLEPLTKTAASKSKGSFHPSWLLVISRNGSATFLIRP
jgi:hypothetical protein